MPGTYVKDALEPVLVNATVTTSGNETPVQVDYPHDAIAYGQVTGAVTGTSPTLDIEVQGADDSGFTTNVVSFGKFRFVTADASSATEHSLQVRVYKQYVRAVRTVGGTSPSFTGVKVTLKPREYHRVAKTTTA